MARRIAAAPPSPNTQSVDNFRKLLQIFLPAHEIFLFAHAGRASSQQPVCGQLPPAAAADLAGGSLAPLAAAAVAGRHQEGDAAAEEEGEVPRGARDHLHHVHHRGGDRECPPRRLPHVNR